jgi:hypothetical protein
VVLFLLRDGDGRVSLAKAPSLSSWVRGSAVDPCSRWRSVDTARRRSRADELCARRLLEANLTPAR